jgi:hypothetical protein
MDRKKQLIDTNINQKKVGTSILIFARADFKVRKFIRDGE